VFRAFGDAIFLLLQKFTMCEMHDKKIKALTLLIWCHLIELLMALFSVISNKVGPAEAWNHAVQVFLVLSNVFHGFVHFRRGVHFFHFFVTFDRIHVRTVAAVRNATRSRALVAALRKFVLAFSAA